MSQLLNTQLDKETLTTCVRMIESGVNPEALAVSTITAPIHQNKPSSLLGVHLTLWFSTDSFSEIGRRSYKNSNEKMLHWLVVHRPYLCGKIHSIFYNSDFRCRDTAAAYSSDFDSPPHLRVRISDSPNSRMPSFLHL